MRKAEFATRGKSLRSSMYAMTGKLLKRENSQELEASWRPNAGPQTNAVESEADEIAYGGKAGGGKTDFLIGHAIKYHHRSIIFRRTFDEFDGIHSRITDILGSLGRWASSGREIGRASCRERV